jgi:hypothetical protein
MSRFPGGVRGHVRGRRGGRSPSDGSLGRRRWRVAHVPATDVADGGGGGNVEHLGEEKSPGHSLHSRYQRRGKSLRLSSGISFPFRCARPTDSFSFSSSFVHLFRVLNSPFRRRVAA